MRRQLALVSLASCLCIMICSNVNAQVVPLNQRIVQVNINSGIIQSNPDLRAVVYAETILVPDATWLRVRFDKVNLGKAPDGGKPTILRITSIADGGTQHHISQTLKQWRNTSAYFNGNEVLIEIIADPNTAASRIEISSVFAGVGGGDPLATICGPTDDRLPSDDVRVGRVLPIGCTVWLINDSNNCFITAGHCAEGSINVVEFNVPFSDAGGGLQHPGPEDQYAVDLSSKQFINGGVGNDWGYFGCFNNSETGLPAGVVQGDVFELANTPPVENGQSIRITGHGTDSSPPEWNQVQQTSIGPYLGVFGTELRYQTDTTGGNSGSPVIDEETSLAIGVHTHGGCNSGGGQNHGTGINHSGFQNALANPLGVCAPVPPIAFEFPNGLPQLINPAGDMIRVIVSGQDGGEPEPGTGQLHINTGGGFVTIPMQEIAPNEYDAVFGKTVCSSVIEYYFSAQDINGEEVSNPYFAPDIVYSALSAASLEIAFADDFEGDTGWTNSGNAPAGLWERGVPVNCLRGDPPADADGSGNCYLTENDAADCNSDVDDGSVTITSPIMDVSAGSLIIEYWRWFSTTAGGAPMQDIFVIEVTNNAGASWVNLETVGPTGPDVSGGWFLKQFAIDEIITPTDQFQIRFTASDTDPQSVVEAAIDGFRLFEIICDSGVLGDLDGDGVVGTSDLLLLLASWGPCAKCKVPGDCPADLDNDCSVGTSDLLILLGNWG